MPRNTRSSSDSRAPHDEQRSDSSAPRKLYDTHCGVDPQQRYDDAERWDAATQHNPFARVQDVVTSLVAHQNLCACGRATRAIGQHRCQPCIEEHFTQCGEAFRRTVSQGNLQETP